MECRLRDSGVMMNYAPMSESHLELCDACSAFLPNPKSRIRNREDEMNGVGSNNNTVEARKLEHSCPHTLKVKYKGS